MAGKRLIGEILVDHGWVTPQDVNAALRIQAEPPPEDAGAAKTIGAILVEMGKVTNDQIREALDEQGKLSGHEPEAIVSGSGLWGAEEHESEPIPTPLATRAEETPPSPARTRRRTTAGQEEFATVASPARNRAESAATAEPVYPSSQEERGDRDGESMGRERHGDDRSGLRSVLAPAAIFIGLVLTIRWLIGRRRSKSRKARLLEQVQAVANRVPDVRIP